MRYGFGVDVGGTSVKMGLFDLQGNVLDKWDIRTRVANEGKEILPDVSRAIHLKIKEKNIIKNDIIGIGVGVPAPVNVEGVVKGSANLGWNYKHVRQELEELTGLKSVIGNDANIAALGEMWKGGGGGQKNMVMVTLGTGVGGGIIVDGKVLVGAHGAGGEIGHIKVKDHETATCGCGGHGCLEQYASATGIVRIGKIALAKEARKTVLNPERMSAKSIFDAVKIGDEPAIDIAKEFGGFLGKGLAMIATLVDPTVFVIGGGVSRAGEILLPFIIEPYLKWAFFGNKETDFVLATLGNDAGIYGSMKLLLDS